MGPIDLKALCGPTYRIAYDPAATHEPGGRGDPWPDGTLTGPEVSAVPFT